MIVQKDYLGGFEIDIVCWNSIGIEYNGEGHYFECAVYPDLVFRQAIDHKKKRLCFKNNIPLLILKYIEIY